MSGAKLREYHFIRGLARRHEVTHLFFVPAQTADAGRSACLPFCSKSVPVPAPRPYTAAKIARGALGRWPLPVINYTSGEMKAAVAAAAETPFDLVHVDSIHMAAYVPLLRRSRVPVIYDWHNIESEAMRRYAAEGRSLPRKVYALATARQLFALEGRILREEYGHVVCSERERGLLARRAPAARIAVVENGVDAGYFETSAPAVAERRRVLFVGAMAYHANVDAAVRFTRHIWPAVRRRFPEWRLTLAGSDPAPAVAGLAGEEGVEVTGTVDDLRPYYREAVAAIVPLLTGGGTRLKILEAMAAGTPVVSTRLGAEGLMVSPGKDILIAETDEDWLPCLEALWRSRELCDRLTGAGLALVRSRYDWETLGAALADTYRAWVQGAK